MQAPKRLNPDVAVGAAYPEINSKFGSSDPRINSKLDSFDFQINPELGTFRSCNHLDSESCRTKPRFDVEPGSSDSRVNQHESWRPNVWASRFEAHETYKTLPKTPKTTICQIVVGSNIFFCKDRQSMSAIKSFSAPDSNDWLIDSGANTFVVGVGDKAIVSGTVLPRCVNLSTSQGKILVSPAKIRTPFGVQNGLVSDGSPRIIPVSYLSKNGFFHAEDGRSSCKVHGILINLQNVNGIPVLPADATFLAEDAQAPPHLIFDSSLEKEKNDSIIFSESPEFLLAGVAQQSNTPKDAQARPPSIFDSSLEKEKNDSIIFSASPEFFSAGVAQQPNTPNFFQHSLTHHPKHQQCGICRVAKLPFAPTRRVVGGRTIGVGTAAGEKIQGDLCGPWPSTPSGERMLLCLRDDFSNIYHLCPLKGKLPSAVKMELSRFLTILKGLRGKDVTLDSWILKTDWGGEFTGLNLRDFIAEKGGFQEFGAPGRHVSIAERLVKSCAQGIRTLLLGAGLSSAYWGHAARVFCFNHNAQNPAWVAYRKKINRPWIPRVFGQLVFVKLTTEQFPGTKADTPGRPCAFLGYEESTTRSMWVAFRKPTASGGLSVTLVDAGLNGKSARWEPPDAQERPVMAFRFVQRDLRMLSVPGDEPDVCGAEPDAPAVRPLQADPCPPAVEGKYSQPVPAWFDESSSCPACRGRQRCHTYSRSCRFAGLTNKLVLAIRRLGSKRTSDEQGELFRVAREAVAKGQDPLRLVKAAISAKGKKCKLPTQPLEPVRSVRAGPTGPDALFQSSEFLCAAPAVSISSGAPQRSGAASATLVGSGDLLSSTGATVATDDAKSRKTVSWPSSIPPEIVTTSSARMDEETNSSSSKLDNSRVCESQTPSRDGVSGLNTAIDANTAATTRKLNRELRSLGYVAVSSSSKKPVFSNDIKSVENLSKEFSLGRFEDKKELSAECFMTYFPSAFMAQKLTDLDTPMPLFSAHVARKMTPQEKRSPPGIAAMSKEMSKLVQHGLYGEPVSAFDITDNRATVSPMAMLGFVKGVENPDFLKHLFKGRAVVLGDRIQSFAQYLKLGITESADTTIDTRVFWDSLQSELAALEESRILEAYATVHGYACETVDLENAYLQCEWPSSEATHYLTLPPELIKMLPPHLQPPSGMRCPVWPMKRAGYGHPASGALWVNKLLSWLVEQGWVPVGRNGSRALLVRGKCVLCAYVDDIKITGPRAELDDFWSSAEKMFVFKEKPAVCSVFLGIHHTRADTDTHYRTHISMVDYIRDTVAAYTKDFGVVPFNYSVPLIDNLRTVPPEACEARKPDKRVQKCIGRLLWIARCTRPDLALACSALGGRVSTWTDECSAELRRTVGYLNSTADLVLEFRWPKGVSPLLAKLELFSDSDWSVPKSQSCGFACMWYNSDGKDEEFPSGFLPLHYCSKKQSIGLDAVSAAEIFALHTSLKICGPAMVSAQTVFHHTEPFVFRVDNTTALKHVVKSQSDTVYFALKAVNARHGLLRDGHTAGLYGCTKVGTDYNRADLGTKVLQRLKLERARLMAGVVKA